MDGTRKKIGILLYNQKEWTGGLYYLLNLIRSLKFLPDTDKPQLVFFYSADYTDAAEEINAIYYPYVSYLPIEVNIGLLGKVINRIKRFFNSEATMFGSYAADIVDFIYPCYDLSLEGKFSFLRFVPKIYWIPDFQDKYYPYFFTLEELERREKVKKELIEKNVSLVFSSYDASQDFKKFYPEAKNKITVLRFASILPDIGDVVVEEVYKKYKITLPYIISPNQFWAHKNHSVVIDAVSLLVKRNLPVHVLFTGNERNKFFPEYASDLKKKVQELQLEAYISFLGFIDRKEQLVLMKHASVVVQPSLFEGWSTVIEDTKVLGNRLIVSDLSVHREQCKENVVFFDPFNPEDLADKINKQLNTPVPYKPINYNEKIKLFANDFLNLNTL